MNSTFPSRAVCTFFANSFTRFLSLREPTSTRRSCVLHILNVERALWQKNAIDFCGRTPWWCYRISDRHMSRCTFCVLCNLRPPCAVDFKVFTHPSALHSPNSNSTVQGRKVCQVKKESGRGRTGQLTTPSAAAAARVCWTVLEIV